MSGSIKVGGNTIATHTGAQGAGEVTLGTNLRLPASGGIQDSSGNNVLTESGGTITLTADETNVGSNALVVNSSGNVGIATNSPTQRLQVDGGAFRITGNYATIANNQGLLIGFDAASDEARYYAVGANGGGVGEHVFYSYNYSTGAGSEHMRIDSSGNVGIGTSSPSEKLNLVNVTATPAYMRVSNSFGSGLIGMGGANQFEIAGTSTNPILFYTSATERMRIDSSGALILTGSTAQKATGTTWSNPSDQRLKSNILDYPKGTAELMQVRVREWEYNGKGGTVAGTKGLGVIADEIMTVLPNTVDNYEAKLNVDDEETTQIKKFDATEITWLLVKTTQEQQTLIESQQSQIDALTARIEVLETQPT